MSRRRVFVKAATALTGVVAFVSVVGAGVKWF